MRFGGEAIKSEAEGYNQQILKRLKEEEERQQKLRQEQEEKQREETYQGALKAMESAVNSGQLKEVIGRLKTLGEYRDAAAKMAAAAEKLAQFEKKEQAKRKKNQRMAATVFAAVVAIVVIAAVTVSAVTKRNQYNQAVQAAESLLQNGDYDRAYRQFAELLGEEKAREEIIKAMYSVAIGCLETEEYRKALYLLREMDQYTDDPAAEATRLGNAMYQAAQKYVEAGEYDKAAALLSAIGELPDTADTAEAAARLGSGMYQAAMKHVNAEEYDKAAALLSAIGKLPNISDASEAVTRLRNVMYQVAQGLVSAEEYDEAEKMLFAIEKLPSTVDKDEWMKKLEIEIHIRQAEVGDSFFFGCYEQDKDSYGPEEIEWIVFDKDSEGNLLLFSRYILDEMREQYQNAPKFWDYGEERLASCWEFSDLRTWLNNTFYDSAFSEIESGYIRYTVRYNSSLHDDPYGGSPSEIKNSTMEDRVFALSWEEVCTYFGLRIRDSDYTYLLSKNGEYFWGRKYKDNSIIYNYYLSTTDENLNPLVVMSDDINIYSPWSSDGGKKAYGVRPAIWIGLQTQ